MTLCKTSGLLSRKGGGRPVDGERSMVAAAECLQHLQPQGPQLQLPQLQCLLHQGPQLQLLQLQRLQHQLLQAPQGLHLQRTQHHESQQL
ncbi:unnamed protein product [Closterium sp. NIES-53]